MCGASKSHTDTHTQSHTHTVSHTHSLTHTVTHTQSQSHTHTESHTHSHTYTQSPQDSELGAGEPGRPGISTELRQVWRGLAELLLLVLVLVWGPSHSLHSLNGTAGSHQSCRENRGIPATPLPVYTRISISS